MIYTSTCYRCIGLNRKESKTREDDSDRGAEAPVYSAEPQDVRMQANEWYAKRRDGRMMCVRNDRVKAVWYEWHRALGVEKGSKAEALLNSTACSGGCIHLFRIHP